MRQLPDIAAVEIARLRKLGVKLADDDIIWLASLAYQVENPHGKTAEAAGCVPGVRLSNGVVLHPLTVKADRWLKLYGPAFADTLDLYAVAYAMANPDKLDLTDKAAAAISAVTSWAYCLNISLDELSNAVRRLMSDDTPCDPDAKTLDADQVIALLVAGTGQSAEYWDNQAWDAISAAYSGVIQYAAMLSETGGDPEAAASKTALRYFALAIQEITKRSAENG